MGGPDWLQQLQRHGDPTQACAARAYYKSGREHWGVPIPTCQRLARDRAKHLGHEEVIQLAEDLWATNLFEPMICAAKLLSWPKLAPSPRLWKALLDCLSHVDCWVLEDQLSHAAWKCVLTDRTLLDTVETWTYSPNFWMRRAALVYTLPFAKPHHDPERMLQWASRYAKDPEWFIQKAIGWWLRVLGAHNPGRVVQFLRAHWGTLKGVARKEATRKIIPEKHIHKFGQSLVLSNPSMDDVVHANESLELMGIENRKHGNPL